jgi:CBS domain-containing protein
MICPSCGHDNMEGTDRCENCMNPLRDLDVPRGEAAAGLVRSVMEDDLRRLSREAPVLVKRRDPVETVVRRLKKSRPGTCALVLEDGKLVGIFTAHDVLCKLAGQGARDMKTPVDELMSPNPEILRETDSVAAALNKMSMGRYRHVPVKDDGGYSVASIRDVLNYIEQADW